MVGLGCGARSYTRGLHYSLDYAVGPKGIKGIIADYLARGCHIGYVHLDRLKLYDTFGDGVLERIPLGYR